MPKYLMLALNGPVGGQEEEFNRWYNEDHVPELLTIPGFVAARRYKILNGKIPESANWSYVAAYEIETDDLPGTLAGMGQKLSPYSPALDRSQSGNIIAIEIGANEVAQKV